MRNKHGALKWSLRAGATTSEVLLALSILLYPLLLTGCRRAPLPQASSLGGGWDEPSSTTVTDTERSLGPPVEAPTSPDPLGQLPTSPRSEASVVRIDLEQLGSILVRLPAGDRVLPAIFVTHGAGGSAEAHLEYWAQLLGETYIIFAVQGSALNVNQPEQGHYYKNHHELERQVLALVEHLKDRKHASIPYVARLAPTPWIYAGYSQGATMGALFSLNHAKLLSRLILIEGGTEGFTFSRVRGYLENGAEKILWVCGTQSCLHGARRASATSARVGLQTRVALAQGAGHIYWGAVADRVAEQLPWVLADD
jgi:pimeloyl-ACP methyl ester carboxylesterase